MKSFALNIRSCLTGQNLRRSTVSFPTLLFRRCLDWEEEQEAANSGRVMRCRWVLTWKPTPDESLEEAQQEIQNHPDTTALNF